MDYWVEGACIPRMVWYRWLREALGFNACVADMTASDRCTRYKHMAWIEALGGRSEAVQSVQLVE